MPWATSSRSTPKAKPSRRWPWASDFVQLIHAADLDGDGQAEVIGLGPSQAAEAARVGDNIVFGIGPRGEELWHYDLPAGLPANGALELVASGNLLDSEAGQWVLAGPDGSVHILAADGTLVDRFNTGIAISGLTVAATGDAGMLVVASEAAEWKPGDWPNSFRAPGTPSSGPPRQR